MSSRELPAIRLRDRRHEPLRVALLPAYRGNVYLVELVAALGRQGARVECPAPRAGAVLRAILRLRPHILHLHWLDAFSCGPNGVAALARTVLFLVGLTAARRLGVRIVWTVHNLTPHDHRYLRLDRWCRRRVWALADAVVTHCEAARRAAEDAFPLRHRVRPWVVAQGHYAASYPNDCDRGTARASLELEPGAVVFLFLGQIRPYKGLAELLDAFEALGASDARLLVAGLPRGGERVEALARRLADQPRVLFRPGFVPDHEVQLYLNACDAVVLPYRQVLTSGSAMLALSFGRPCIAPRRGCLPELLGESELLYDPAAPAGLLESLRWAVKHRDRLDGVGAGGRERVLTWSWDRVAAATLQIYCSCLGR